MISLVGRSAVLVPALALALVAASPAGATPDTLRRAAGNIAMAPLDLALSPFTATRSVVVNIQEIEDTTGVRIAYFLPGIIWNTGLYMGAATMRGITGLIEFLPGLLLLPFEADLDPLFAPSERNDALVEIETPVMDIKFGVHYVE